MTGLSPEQVRTFHEDGFLVIPDALDSGETAGLLQEAYRMLDEDLSLSDHPMTKFSTGETGSHVGDDYFLTSGDKIRFFFEEDAFDATGALTKPKEKAINKIGHYLHELNPEFRRTSLSARNAKIARDLGFHDPRVLQSMVICKQPEIGGRVPPHQDSTFLYTDPPSAVGFWYALEECTVHNGCLSFAAGSHTRSPVAQRFVRTSNGKGTEFVENDGNKWPAGLEGQNAETRENQYELAEVKAGTLVLIHGNTMHKSERNSSDKGRMIYTFHVIEGENEYDGRNWLQPPGLGFSQLVI